ncbi:hypothetical protein [Ulvibacterium marinum]|uniref:Uncharacterized protein n=1 Tax=Ulvibacterium marinum TaxID=2419782 RepID=A0A3B0C8P1_9FLAO|nr:hypothetical protein [Ulvibacterium marinum]RKN81041.1 hypothetical protein D7Z94_08810 [Ulvibacterium marinum]
MRSKGFKVVVSLVVILFAFAFYLFHYVTNGIGEAAEKSIKAVHEVSKSLDSTDYKKLDSLKQEVVQKLDSLEDSKSTD